MSLYFYFRTNQHSCGNVNNHCELVIQYMCGDLVRDGTTTKTIPDNRWECDRADCDTDMEYVIFSRIFVSFYRKFTSQLQFGHV